jgi:hypothetical protein
MGSRGRLASLLIVTALAVGLPVASTAAPVKKKKPHAGQICNPKKKPPTGFKCVLGKGGKFRLKKI